MKNSLRWAVYALALATSASMAATQTRTSAFEYDPSSGLLVKEIIEPDNSALCLVTTYSYDAYGNKTGATTRNCNGSSSEAAAPSDDPVFASRTSTSVYAAGSSWTAGQFPTTTTNALSQSETKTYDGRFGTVASLTGPNGLTTSWTYDNFGRKTLETRADSTTTSWTYTRCADIPGVCPSFAANQAVEASTGAPTKTVYIDTLGREIRSEVQGFDGRARVTDGSYDALGRLINSSKPRYPGETVYLTTFSYDILGRGIQTEEPSVDGNVPRTVTTYNGLTVSVTLSNAGAGTNMPAGAVQTKTSTKNSQGQPVTVTDTQGNTVTYTYDPFGNLLTTNAGGVVTSLVYDLRGRKTSMADPDKGNWAYYYNALGELIRQTDAKSQTVTMSYDLLGRMTNRSEPDLVSTWTYDSCTKGIGKLCSVSATNGYSRLHGYDGLGRPSTLSITIDTAYSISTTYDSAGRVDTVTYPTGYAVKNDPDSTVYWTANAQNAAGQVTSELLGNSLTTTRTYDALFRMSAVTSTGTGGTVHNLAYTFDAVSNVSQRQDLTQSVTENFSYDTLNRLTSASGSGLTTRSFDYNPIGNVIYKSDVGTYSYPASGQRHAVASVSGGGAANTVTASYGYDANGNLTSASGTIYPSSGSVSFSRTLTPSSYDMPSTLTHVQGGSTYSYTYTYSAEHQRVRLVTQRPDGTFTSIYVHPGGGNGALLYEKEIRASDGRIEHKHYVNGGAGLTGVFVTKTIYAGGEAPEMRYYHRDHLGSVAVITNPAAAVIERLAYEAYGERRYPNGTAENRSSPLIGVTTDRGYTAHEHLDEMMLIHMNGRIYDPVLARFMMADPLVQSASNLQDYNRYSYVNNNPFTGVDPSGYSRLSRAVHRSANVIGAAFGLFAIRQQVDFAKSVWNSEVGRIVITVVVSYYTAGLASEWLMAAAADSIAAGGIGSAFMTVGAEAGELTALGSATVGASSGFAASFVGSGGNLKAGINGAATGAMGGALAGYYGNGYSLSRVAAESTVSGIGARLQGRPFMEGFRLGLGFSGLTYANYLMNRAALANSMLNPDNVRGDTENFFGQGPGIGGSRQTFIPGTDEYDICQSNALGCQGQVRAGIDQQPNVLGVSCPTGTFCNRVGEAFAGPHDTFRNLTGSYDQWGNAKYFAAGSWGATVDSVMNYALIVPAAPFAGAALLSYPQSLYNNILSIKNPR